jgi:hypothetical protein
MKTLINIYENIKPKIAYHVADSDDRNSIKKFGLDPSKSKNDLTTSGKNIYLFLKLSEAKSYISGYKLFLINQEEDERNFDIWEINVSGLKLIKDLGLNDGDDPKNNSAYFTKAPISKKRIKLKVSI